MQIEAGKTEGNTGGNSSTWRNELLQLGESADRQGTKVLRDNLEVINHLVDRGVSLKTIHSKLKENGFRLTYKSFIQTLKLVRKEKRNLSDTPDFSSTPFLNQGGTSSTSSNKPSMKSSATQLERPPGITSSAWAEMQQKHREILRRQQNLKGSTK